MTNREVLEMANNIVAPHGLRAEFLEGVCSVGVGGDCRTYTGVLVLIGEYPSSDILGSLATQIGNITHINRITIELANKVIIEKSDSP